MNWLEWLRALTCTGAAVADPALQRMIELAWYDGLRTGLVAGLLAGCMTGLVASYMIARISTSRERDE